MNETQIEQHVDTPIKLDRDLEKHEITILLGIYSQNLPASTATRQGADTITFRYLSLLAGLSGILVSNLVQNPPIESRIGLTFLILALVALASIGVFRRARLYRALYATNWCVETALGCHVKNKYIKDTSIFRDKEWSSERKYPLRQHNLHICAILLAGIAAITLTWAS